MRTFLGVAFVLLLAACASESMSDGRSMYELGLDEYGTIPEADPGRAISVQDCTRQLRRDGGNLRCR
ncbi:MAG TPA: hypothetical protein VFK92_08985 [Burkholderiales bacterium]|nr:hypothetical protein [Burkholderiales bacterium]